MNYLMLGKSELLNELGMLQNIYEEFKSRSLVLDMARGKPNSAQLDLSDELLDATRNLKSLGIDTRNYGGLEGETKFRGIMADLLDVALEEVIACGNSSLSIMYDSIQRAMQFGVFCGDGAWNGKEVKFLCPVPGYDRHFSICELMGIKMISIPMLATGPDMDMVEDLVANDSAIKGIWCVPKYSNPDGITYSDDTVRRFAKLKPASNDFRIFWDNAYFVHDLYDEGDSLLNIMTECKKNGTEDMVYIFASTSKITYAGAGVACMSASVNNIKHTKKLMSIQTIGPDKLNQLLHAEFLKSKENVYEHMRKHAEILRPKFETVLNMIKEFEGTDIIEYINPRGGYFISINVPDGCASEVVKLCAGVGVNLTPSGSSFPYHIDPRDRNLRIAPTFPTTKELEIACEVLANCIKIAAYNKALKQY